jgi:type II secretion system protein G
MKRRLSKGFTLIELLVVIAIIGLLATLSVVAFESSRIKARDAKRKSDLKNIQKALELYYTNNNAYPITGAGVWLGVCATYGSKATTGANGYVPNLAPTYISVLPIDPRQASMPVNACYLYRSDDGQQYKLLTYLTAESTPDPADPFRDQAGRGSTFAVCFPPGSAACGW